MTIKRPEKHESWTAFKADIERMSAKLLTLDAVRYGHDLSGDYAWIDEEKAPPELVSAYAGLCRFGYANGLIPPDGYWPWPDECEYSP